MECIYCGSATSVVNSRPQKRSNSIWRRRKCLRCGAIFTSRESIDLSGALALQKQKSGQLQPFSKDKLLISIYESCRHRPNGSDDSAHLTQTIIDRALPLAGSGAIKQDDLIAIAIATLESFDKTAAAVYKAYHPTKG